MTSARKSSNCSGDFLEYMASFKHLNDGVVNVDSSSDEVEIVKELTVRLEDHRCDLCCEGEFLVDKLLRYGGLINEKYKFVCDQCDKNFVYKSELKKHSSHCAGPVLENNEVSFVGEKTPDTIKCSACSKTCKSRGGLTKHMKKKHSGLTHTCELCKKVFSDFQKFRSHCFEHERARPHYMCNKCDRRFRWETGLKRHKIQCRGKSGLPPS